MTPPTPRPCPCCGGAHIGREPLCSLCWNLVPGKYRTAVYQAQKALGYNPASARVQEQLRLAIANACGAIS